MIADTFSVVVRCSVAATLAVVIVAALRPLVRRFFGSSAAICLWLLVPMMMAAAAVPKVGGITYLKKLMISTGPSVAIDALNRAEMVALGTADLAQSITLVVWIVGSVLMLSLGLRAQSRFMRRLGSFEGGHDKTRRSSHLTMPVVAGVFKPRLFLPKDFEGRFGFSERELILAHEHAHLRRRDTETGALAFLFLCLQWFNPLAYWARRAFVQDQEMACDMDVIANADRHSHVLYAELLLRVQSSREALPVAVGANWLGRHPLTKRISALAKPIPGVLRSRIGVGVAVMVTTGISVLAWAAGDTIPRVIGSNEKVAVNVQWAMDVAGPEAKSASEISHRLLTTDIVVTAGKQFTFSLPDNDHPDYQLTCTVRRAQQVKEDGLFYSCQTLAHGKPLDPHVSGHLPNLFGKPDVQVSMEIGAPDPADPRVKLLSSVRLRASLDLRRSHTVQAGGVGISTKQ